MIFYSDGEASGARDGRFATDYYTEAKLKQGEKDNRHIRKQTAYAQNFTRKFESRVYGIKNKIEYNETESYEGSVATSPSHFHLVGRNTIQDELNLCLYSVRSLRSIYAKDLFF